MVLSRPSLRSPSFLADWTARKRLRRAPAGSFIVSLKMQRREWSRRGTRLAKSSVSYLFGQAEKR